MQAVYAHADGKKYARNQVLEDMKDCETLEDLKKKIIDHIADEDKPIIL